MKLSKKLGEGDMAQLAAYLHGAWCAETSNDAEHWTKENPAWGQSAVTACLVRDIVGGEVVRAEVELPNGKKTSHYFNRWTSGKGLDMSREQFAKGTQIGHGCDKRDRFRSTYDYVLSNADTKRRYELLKERLEEIAGCSVADLKRALQEHRAKVGGM